ncbi:cation:proton antiporter domain-containing protein, partial [Polymorphobacter multimanifer]
MAGAPVPEFLPEAVVYLGASVVLVPLFVRAKLGAVLGYLAAGILIGPSVLGLVSEPERVLQYAEFGIVLLLFVIGLELQPSRLWAMRRDIFGLGLAQVVLCGLALT